MFIYRTYQNADPPHLLRIWADCAGRPGLVQPLTMPFLERSVLNKPYFDPHGLILAFSDKRPVGFAHASFAPASGMGIQFCREKGITCLVLVSQEYEDSPVADELLSRCEQYLMSRGALVLYGGSASPWHPFYLGIYGGFQLPGILESDTSLVKIFESHGYAREEHYWRFQLNLANYRPPLDVQTRLQFRRFSVRERLDPKLPYGWDAVSYCESELLDYLLVDPTTDRAVARVRYCKHNPNPHVYPAVGLAEIRVSPQCPGGGGESYLLGESLICLKRQGISIVEAQCPSTDAATAELLLSHGFQRATGGVVFRKDALPRQQS